MSYPPFTWRMLVRRSWMLAAGLLVGFGAAWYLSGIAASASSSFKVRTLERPQSPYPAARLTLTYAQLIPENPEIIRALSRETGLSTSYVEDNLTMSGQPEANVLFARFTAGDPATALLALRSLTTAMKTSDDAAGTPLRRTVSPVSEPVVTGGFSKKKALLLGTLGGLMVAVSIALTLERRRPRVDSLAQLSQILPVPTSRASRSRFATGAELQAREVPPSDVPLPVDRVPNPGPGGGRLFALLPPGAVENGGPERPIALAVEEGVPAADVEERWRVASGSGYDVVTAFLVPRNLLATGRLASEDA
jgi:hypothetical protein